MLRRWCLSLAGAGLLAAAVTAAAAVPAAAAPAAAGRARPGQAGLTGLLRLIRPGVRWVGPAIGQQAGTAQSANWSGYAASGGRYHKVSASWVQPRGRCSAGDGYASFWVGLDGYGSSTVEQTGTEVDCSGGSAQYYSWYEMYPSAPVNFSNPVRPGDHFTGSVTVAAGGKYTLVLADTTRHWRHTIHATLAGAANSSAEVIAEAPSSTLGVLPLTDFGTVHFAGSAVNGAAIGHYHPTRIVMTDGGGQAQDRISGLSHGTAFTATWLRGS